ncbi:MAG: AzlC family ABC transporter permease [Blautia sp.]|nr:AzlC family ABC transporter permease [Blautia sp.]
MRNEKYKTIGSNENNTFQKTLGYAFRQSLPVMAGYVVLGTGFGILLHSKGYGVGWAFLMSLLIYAGSMQYVTIDLLCTGASLISIAFMTVMVNARHLFYGISMIDRYKDTMPYKPYLIFGLTDETYSLVCSKDVPEGVDRTKYYFLVSLLNQSYWIAGSVTGGIIGSLLNFNTAGIEFSMTALFVVVFTEQWLESKNHASALIGLISSVFCLVLFGPSRFLIPTMIMITLLLTVLRSRLETEENVHE